MKVDKTLLKHVSKVARLKLTEAEIKEFLPQLKEILQAFEELKKVDTKNTKPSYHAVDLKNALREDKPDTCLSKEDALKNTKNKKNSYFMGPRVI